MNLATAIPKVKLVHSMGTYVDTLGQPRDHGRMFAFVGEQIGDQLPYLLSFLSQQMEELCWPSK